VSSEPSFQSDPSNQNGAVVPSPEVRLALDALYPEVLETLAFLHRAPEKLADLVVRSLGWGSQKALEVFGIVDSPMERETELEFRITPFGAEVVKAARNRVFEERYSQLVEGDGVGVGLGIDIGHYAIRVALARPGFRDLMIVRAEVEVDKDCRGTLYNVVQLTKQLLADTDVEASQIDGIGLGFPGPIEAESGQVMYSRLCLPYLRDWDGVRVGETFAGELESVLGRRVPVLVENDANLCLLGEVRYGAARGRKDVVFVKASAGIGAGLWLGGRLHHGARATAGEFGHIPVADYPAAEGPEHQLLRRRFMDRLGECERCHQRGCLELLASGLALPKRLMASKEEGLTTFEVGEALAAPEIAGKASCIEAYRREIELAGRWLGTALAGLMLTLDPEIVLIGGTLTRAGNIYLDAVRKEVAHRTGLPRGLVQFAHHREDAGVYGALDLSFQAAGLPTG
jgi:predicted NBD/HSP70 family sugar kinase